MAATPSSPLPGNVTGLMPFTFDLTTHEIRRLTAVLDAMPDWDPAAVLAAEVEAHSLLYSGLNAEQRAPFTTCSAKRVCSMLDRDADLGRRAWLPCPRCCDDGCSSCAVETTSDLHWRYLLANETRLVFLQCPGCMHR